MQTLHVTCLSRFSIICESTFMLKIGRHRSEALQKDWNTYGPGKFVFEVLEMVNIKDDPAFDLNDELALLEEI